jgi:hypothetical protein
MVNGSIMDGDAACVVRLQGSEAPDTRMFCHHELNVCVLACETDADCPAAWVCDQRPESSEAADPDNHRKFCVNPTCGDLK